jgi:hypothetical protein
LESGGVKYGITCSKAYSLGSDQFPQNVNVSTIHNTARFIDEALALLKN